MTSRRATSFVLVAAVLWSAGGIGVKSASGSAMAIAGWRAVFAVPVLAIAFFVETKVRRAPNPFTLAKRPLAWAAAASYATMVVAYVISTKLTTAANSILIQYTGPVYVALLSGPVLGEQVRLSDWASVAGCVLGMLLLFADALDARGLVGNLVAVLSSFGFAGVPILMRLELRRHPDGKGVVALAPQLAMILGNVIAAAACAPAMIAQPLDPRSFGIVALLGVFQIGVAYWLYGSAVGRLDALRSSLLACIEPILNPMWVLLLHGERPSRWALVGGAVILGSVMLQALARPRTKVDSPA